MTRTSSNRIDIENARLAKQNGRKNRNNKLTRISCFGDWNEEDERIRSR